MISVKEEFGGFKKFKFCKACGRHVRDYDFLASGPAAPPTIISRDTSVCSACGATDIEELVARVVTTYHLSPRFWWWFPRWKEFKKEWEIKGQHDRRPYSDRTSEPAQIRKARFIDLLPRPLPPPPPWKGRPAHLKRPTNLTLPLPTPAPRAATIPHACNTFVPGNQPNPFLQCRTLSPESLEAVSLTTGLSHEQVRADLAEPEHELEPRYCC